MRRENRFTYEEDADFRVGNESDWLHTVASRVEGQKILVRGQNVGSQSLAKLVASLLTVTEKVYAGKRGSMPLPPHVQVQYQGIYITSYVLPDQGEAFSWGDGSDGSKRLALAILEDHFADRDRAEFYAKAFYDTIILTAGGDELRITSNQIDYWLFRYDERIAEARRELRDIREEVGRP